VGVSAVHSDHHPASSKQWQKPATTSAGRAASA
jgi:hypothetical protein